MEKLHEAMKKLVPQIRYWLQGVEFGLSWGITRPKGGFLLARVAIDRRELGDTKFAVTAVKDHIALFRKAPRAYAYDRGGYSKKNVGDWKKLGVRETA